MKKKILFSAILALVMLFSLSGIAFADEPTTVNVDWNGAGAVDGSVVSGDDATALFHSEGWSGNIGIFHATDSNNNPYGYGVDSGLFSLDTGISGTGWAKLDINRTDAKTSYGAAGQRSFTQVVIDSGSATLQNRSSTNYASMVDSNYGWNSSNHITVTDSTAYTLQRFMDSGNINFAGIRAFGDGNADLDCMSSEATAGQVRLGWGAGCFTNAKFNATGTGQVNLDAIGNTSVTTALIPGMTGATAFGFVANWINNSFSIADYSTTAK